MTIEVSIGKVKRDISELVNRVTYQGERVVLTSRGRPKAALVSLDDYKKLLQLEQGQANRLAWLAEAKTLAEKIRQRRGGQPVDVDALMLSDRSELEERNG
jgi:prevent-host-death family protein